MGSDNKMNILILGDIVGANGRDALKKNLKLRLFSMNKNKGITIFES